MFDNLDLEMAALEASRILKETLPGAWCVAQEWDNRIDCKVKLRDGRIVGEMVPRRVLTVERLSETAQRLKDFVDNGHGPLVGAILPPKRIIEGED